MGSGLILLIIVGAWLAVLVPMALRAHDTSTAASTVDRFSDAMRVLSRRSTSLPAPEDDVPLVPAPVPRERPLRSVAARRRRVLVVLLLTAVATLVGGVLGPVQLLVPHAVADLLLLAYLAWLRSSAVRRAEREWRTALGDPAALSDDDAAWSPLREWSPRTGVPAGMHGPAAAGADSSRPVLATAPLPRVEVVFDQEAFAAAAAAEQEASTAAAGVHAAVPESPAQVPARGAQGAPWQPVPVPVPTYVTAPRAPRRTVGLATPYPGDHVGDPALSSAERSLGIDDRGPELEHILGRRAVGS